MVKMTGTGKVAAPEEQLQSRSVNAMHATYRAAAAGCVLHPFCVCHLLVRASIAIMTSSCAASSSQQAGTHVPTHQPHAACLCCAAGSGLDLASLCLVPGKTCWLVYVDALVLNDGGNVLGALSMAARAALALTRVYKVCRSC